MTGRAFSISRQLELGITHSHVRTREVAIDNSPSAFSVGPINSSVGQGSLDLQTDADPIFFHAFVSRDSFTVPWGKKRGRRSHLFLNVQFNVFIEKSAAEFDFNAKDIWKVCDLPFIVFDTWKFERQN